jgi:ribosomal protein L23
MPTLYTVIRRPLITEKGLAVKETEGTLVFDVAPGATKTEVKQAVEGLFKVKVAPPMWLARNAAAASSPASSRIGRRHTCG